jgi:hypothetical protein
MRIHALQPLVQIHAATGTLVGQTATTPALSRDALSLSRTTSAIPAVATSLTANACDCGIDEHLTLAAEADQAGAAYYAIARGHYVKATEKAGTRAVCERVGDHAAVRGYGNEAKVAREKGIVLGMSESVTTAQRLDVAAKADSYGSAFYDDAGRCYAEATTKATSAADLYAIGTHAGTRGYGNEARAAREKGILAGMTEATTLAARLATAATADGFGSAFYDDAGRSYAETTAKATTSADLYATGAHAAARGYGNEARAAREKGILAGMHEATTTEARLATATMADGFGSAFYDDAGRCYAEAIAKAGNRSELTAIAQHAGSRGYGNEAKKAREKALAC